MKRFILIILFFGGIVFLMPLILFFLLNVRLSLPHKTGEKKINEFYAKDDASVYFLTPKFCSTGLGWPFEQIQCDITYHKIPEADPKTFEVSLSEVSRFNYHLYLGKDKNHIFLNSNIVKKADPKTFNCVDDKSTFCMDDKYVFCQSYLFNIAETNYSKELNGVINFADRASFKILNEEILYLDENDDDSHIYAEDKNYFYDYCDAISKKDKKIIKKFDEESQEK